MALKKPPVLPGAKPSVKDSPRKSATSPRGRPFQPGNPGKAKGTRHKITRAIQELLDGEGEAITRKAIDLAKGGDLVAIRLVLERLCPPVKSRTIEIDLPKVERPEDVLLAIDAVVQAAAGGDLSIEEAGAFVGLLEMKRRAFETLDLERRIAAIEATAAPTESRQ
jgi:hypothetical protein